ncbi:MAG: HYR domain-containing protein, partial [Bacteroidales bacterium]|nr:HYR domain-containing protein [Bacteroidales bacterium]
VTDASGNPASCTQNIVVTDIELPTIVCPTTVNVNTDAGLCTASNVVLGTPTTADNCTVAGVTNNAPAVFPIGTTTVTWTVTDASGNPASCTQNIVVTDIELPTIVCPPTVNVNTDAGLCTASNVVLGTPTTADNCTVAGVTNNAPAVFPIGTTTVTWTVTDASGNPASCQQLVNVTDIELPTIVCPPTVNVNTDAGLCTASGVILGTPTTADNCTVANITNNAPTVFPIGTTTVTWTVTDASGNPASCTQNVMVTDIELPTIVCPADIVSCSNTIILTPPTVADNCGIADITNNAPQVFPIGQTTQVTWTVTDIHGNISECTQNISISDIQISISASSQVSCHDASDAIITATSQGTTGNVVYQINGGTTQSSNVFEGLPAGTYIIEAIDENGCSGSSGVITITNPEQMDAIIIITNNISCYNSFDGEITINTWDGTPPYIYTLNDQFRQTSNVFIDLGNGHYIIKIEDANGCFTIREIDLNQPDSISLSYEGFCLNEIIGVRLTGSGGTQPYSYSIDGGQNYSTNNEFETTNAGEIIYLVIKDANNCLSQAKNVQVKNLISLTADVNIITENLCYGDNDAAVMIVVEGGTSPYEYNLNNQGYTTNNTFQNLAAGSHTIKVRDFNTCPASTSFEIEEQEPIVIDLLSLVDSDCTGFKGGSAEISAQGGEPPYSYNWSNGVNQAIVTNLAKGIYTATITDYNQCEILYNIEIKIDPTEPQLGIPNVFSPNGDGINDTWVIENLELYPENELVIINRWGNEVYTQKSYNNNWDGMQLNEGTYFYVLKANMCNEERKFTGYITIIK